MRSQGSSVRREKSPRKTRCAVRYALCALLWVALFAFAGCATVRPPARDYFAQGKELAAMGDWDRSVQALQKAFQERPEDKEVRLLLIRAKKNASQAHLETGKAFLRETRLEEAITEFQMSIALDSTNTYAESLLIQAKNMKEADYQLKRAETLLRTGTPTQALEALEAAVRLDPSNQKAQEMLKSVRERTSQSPLRTKLDAISPISLKFKDTPILNVFETLTKLTGVNFIFDRELQDTKVTVFVTDVVFDEFLEVFLRTNKLAHKIVNEKSIIIYPDTPAKAKEYRDLQIRTIYLAHLDTKRAVMLLSKVLKSKDIIANDMLNAVVIRGPKELVEIASRMIEANDRPVSEVMLGVEILEVARTKDLNLGVEFTPPSIGVGLGQGTGDFFNPDPRSDTFRAIGGASLKALAKVSSANILLSLPTATINLLKQDGDTNILAKPQLRVKNGEKARIHIGERIPLRSNRRVDTTSAVTTDYQYQDVGVKLEVEPHVNLHNDINIKMILEVSALGSNLGTSDDPQFSISTRTAQTVLNIRAGETVVVGGLISDQERRSVRRVPGLGDLPVLGHLFSNRNNNDVKTDVLMTITPIVVRSLEVPDQSLTQIWSGREDEFSTDKPFDTFSGPWTSESVMPSERGDLEPPVGAEPDTTMPPQLPFGPPGAPPAPLSGNPSSLNWKDPSAGPSSTSVGETRAGSGGRRETADGNRKRGTGGK